MIRVGNGKLSKLAAYKFETRRVVVSGLDDKRTVFIPPFSAPCKINLEYLASVP